MNQMSNSSSTAYFANSSPSTQQTNMSNQESLAKQYINKLENYLTSILEKEVHEGIPAERSTARQKLSRLNNTQFHELATDVYDELIRRTSDNQKSFLPMEDAFHPRRNQARQKLATLPNIRFRDLASDVYYELHRRYPDIDSHPPMKKLDMQGLPSKSTNIIPVKGMMSVESLNFSDSEEEPVLLEDSSMEDSSNTHQSNNNNSEVKTELAEEMKYEYERRIESMEKQIQMLEITLDNEINSSNGTTTDKERQMKLKQMHEEYKKLDIRFEQLNAEHNEQQRAIHKVKSEMKQLIDELKTLSNKNESLQLQNKKADVEIQELIQENKSWKRKYETISMELRGFKVAPMDVDNEKFSKEFFLKPNPNGAIGQQFIVEFQIAIDDLMKSSRSSKPSDVLFSMRNIVMACKAITTEVEGYEIKTELSLQHQEALYDIKRKFTNELTNLLAATKNFANGTGISPVSLVDASAGNLTGTIVDLVKLLGMKPIQDLESGIYSLSNIENNTKVEEFALTDFTNMTPTALSAFLKSETDHIVLVVQNLLSALRSNDSNLFEIITSIVNIVTKIINTCNETFSEGEGARYRTQGANILNDLGLCNQKITQIRDSSFANSARPANAIAKQNLAQESYEIAKYINKLTNMLDL